MKNIKFGNKLTDYLDLLDSLVDSIAIIRTDGEIIATNAAWIEFSVSNSGIQSKTGAGVNYLDVARNTVGEDKEMALRAYSGISAVIQKEIDYFELEYPCDSPDEKRWFLLRAVTVVDNEKLILLSHVNITQRKRAEMEIEQRNRLLQIINKELEQVMYRLIHDIRGPVNSLKGLIMLAKKEQKQGDIDHYLDLMDQSAKGLSEFIQEILGLVRTAHNPIKVEEIDFEALLEQLVTSIQFMKELSHVNLSFKTNQEYEFHSDINSLKLILSNLVINAIKYSDKDKQDSYVQVFVTVKKSSAIISVKDNGLGMDNKEKGRIHEKSYRADNKKQGEGLGLFLVFQSLEKLSGQLEVRSEKGKGSEFICTFPTW